MKKRIANMKLQYEKILDETFSKSYTDEFGVNYLSKHDKLDEDEIEVLVDKYLFWKNIKPKVLDESKLIDMVKHEMGDKYMTKITDIIGSRELSSEFIDILHKREESDSSNTANNPNTANSPNIINTTDSSNNPDKSDDESVQLDISDSSNSSSEPI